MQDFVYWEDFFVHLSRNPQPGYRVGNSAISPQKFFSISCVAIAVENLRHPRRRKNCDGSTYQSNNFGVSRKRFKPSMPGSKAQRLVFDNSYIVCTVLLRNFHCSLHVNFTQKMQKFGMYVCMYTVSPKKHVTTFSTITLTISVQLQ